MKYSNILAGFLLITSVIMLSFSGCKKYEEDDYWFTLRSINKRLVGKKELVECTYNGADSMAFFKRYFGDFYFDFSENGDHWGKYLNVYHKGSNEQINVNGDSKWQFSKINKTNDAIYLTLKINDSISFNPHYMSIKKLTKNEMHLTGMFFGFNVIPWDTIPQLPISLKFRIYEN